MNVLVGGVSPGGRWLVLGAGFLVGQVLLVLVMAVVWSLGLFPSMGLVSLGLFLVALAGLLSWIALGQRGPAAGASPAPAFGSRRLALLVGLLVVWQAVVLLPDIVLRPVLPWDAWQAYLYKARAWFESGELLALVPESEWATAPPDVFVGLGTDHPPFISLVLLWQAIAVDRWDDSLLGWPWAGCALACGSMIHAVARREGMPVWGALAPVAVLLSLPMFATHVAMVGYADLWMAVLILLFAVALMLWLDDRRTGHFVLMLIPAMAMVFVKDTGSYWLVVLVCALLAGLLPLRLLLLAVATAVVAMPAFHVVGWDPAAWLSGGRFSLQFDFRADVIAGIMRHQFYYADWLLLWYLTPLLLLAACWPAARMAGHRALLGLVVSGLVLLSVAFLATRAGQYAIIGTLFSRMLLHLVPVMVLLGALTVWFWLRRRPGEGG